MISDKDITAIRQDIKNNREAVWNAILPLLPPTDPSAKLLQVYLNELKVFRKTRLRPRFKLPKTQLPGKHCKICLVPKGTVHDQPKHRKFLYSQAMKAWLTNWWKDKPIAQRQSRTRAANEARRAVTNNRLLTTVPQRLRDLLGDSECIRRLRNRESLGLA